MITDLYERVRKTIDKERDSTCSYDDDGNLMNEGFPDLESFEFLIFVEIRNSDREVLLHYPVAIGHEPTLEETMREQFAAYSRLVPDHTVAVLAIENSLTRFEDWDLFGTYRTAEDLVNAAFDQTVTKETGAEARRLNFSALSALIEENPNESPFTQQMTEKQMFETIRFNTEDHQSLPLVISSHR